jgi:cytochrome P450
MRATLPRVGHWIGRHAAAWGGRRGQGLSALALVPDRLTMPLRRDGLDPMPELAVLHAKDPVTRWGSLLGTRIWLVTGHAEARTVLADTQRYSTDIRPYIGAGRTAPEDSIGGLGFTDPPDHTRLRRLLAPHFTRHRLEALRPRIERIVADRLDEIEAAGPDVDLLETFAFPVPFLTICELLGLPDEDRVTFRRVSAARFDLTSGGLGTFGALSESRAFLLDVVRRQRRSPGDGLLGRIVTEHGDDVDDVELSGLADGVFVGGYETTASMLGLGTLLLLDRPDGLDPLRAGDAAVETCVEELLRVLSVVQIAFPRFAKEDLDLAGHRIRRGDVVVCSVVGANRDPRLVDVPHAFDPARPVPQHLAFGYGAHRCLGAELARIELRTALPALARRFPHLALAADAGDLGFRKLSIVHGLERLPVRAW